MSWMLHPEIQPLLVIHCDWPMFSGLLLTGVTVTPGLVSRVEVVLDIAGELDRGRAGARNLQAQEGQKGQAPWRQTAGHHDESPSTYG